MNIIEQHSFAMKTFIVLVLFIALAPFCGLMADTPSTDSLFANPVNAQTGKDYENSWKFSAEFGFGVKHNDDGGVGLLRGTFGDKSWGGCGFVIGGWTGEFRNQVVGLNCIKRIKIGWFKKREFYTGIGLVDISESNIVNSSFAFELHLRYVINKIISLAVTHYSNAGTHHPNRGFNFISVEFAF
ncbi:MAG: hypothetical protein DHS20C01_08220 [marine bacterium B5-7]|nr:MAG: hypothetical protein DHS20C01_08220 [marine bacterium B5-7]